MKKYIIYFIYLMKHKYYVFTECCKFGIPLLGLLHDIDKLKPFVFFYYSNGFKCEDIPKFYNAYNHLDPKHKKKSKHHYEHYINNNELKEIPMKYRKEMMADWIVKSRYQNNNLMSWYTSSSIVRLAPNTKKWVENFLESKYTYGKR